MMSAHLDRAWRVVEWDRARGRGVICCEALGELSFDGSAALCDDFRLGEAVLVTLVKEGASYRVVRIGPENPRVRAPDGAPEPPELMREVAASLARRLTVLPVLFDCRILAYRDGDLVVQGDCSNFDHGCQQTITFRGVEYIDLPSQWGGKTFQVAEREERRYVATRVDLSTTSAVIKIVDDQLRAHFVVCDAVETSLQPEDE